MSPLPRPLCALAQRSPAFRFARRRRRQLPRRARASAASGCCASRTSTRRARAPARPTRSWPTSRPSACEWDGPVLRQSDRFDAYAEAIERLRRAGALRRMPLQPVCPRRACPRMQSRPDRHGRGTVPPAGLPAAQMPTRARARAAPAGAGRGRRIRRPQPGPAGSRRARPRSATSCCSVATACLPTSWPSSSTTPHRASPTSCAAATCSRARRGRSLLQRAPGPAGRAIPAFATCRGRPGP